MAEVNPAEVSAILKQQLSGFEAKASLDEVGTYLQLVTVLQTFMGFLMRSTEN